MAAISDQIVMILAIFDLQVTPMLPTKFQINWPFGSAEEAKNRFSRWRPSWIFYKNNFTLFDLQVSLMLPNKFQVNWPSGSGEEAKNGFSRGGAMVASWIYDQNDFSYS